MALLMCVCVCVCVCKKRAGTGGYGLSEAFAGKNIFSLHRFFAHIFRHNL